MNEKLIKQMVKEIVKNIENIELTKHAKKRMRERKISMNDILEILNNSTYIGDDRESGTKNFKGKMNYRMMGKFEWSVVVSIYYPTKLIVVTVID